MENALVNEVNWVKAVIKTILNAGWPVFLVTPIGEVASRLTTAIQYRISCYIKQDYEKKSN
jgi:hypothetical protein